MSETPRRPYFLDPAMGAVAPAPVTVRAAAFGASQAPSVRPLFTPGNLEPSPDLAPLEPLDLSLETAVDVSIPEASADFVNEPPADVSPVTPRAPAAADFAPLAAAVARLEARTEELIERTTQDALDLAVEIARRILRTELARPEALLPVVREAASMLATAEPLMLRLHPEDLALWETAGSAQALGAGSTVVKLISDETLTRGDCVVEDGSGVRVESRLDARLDRVRAALGGEGEAP